MSCPCPENGPLPEHNTQGGGAKCALSSSVQFEGGRAYQMPSEYLPVELGRVADSARPLFWGVAHVE